MSDKGDLLPATTPKTIGFLTPDLDEQIKEMVQKCGSATLVGKYTKVC